MNRIVKLIPNTITCLNLLSGCVALVFAFHGNFVFAFWAVIAAVVFDFLDGFCARLLNAYSPMGKELDSLADMVSFGVVPSVVMFVISGSYVAFMIAIFSALRLAKFNIDTRQNTEFIGMPTPANALFFMALGYVSQLAPDGFMALMAQNNIFQRGIVVAMSYFLVSEVPMFSFKFKTYALKQNTTKYTFLTLSLLAIILFQVAAIPCIVIGYVAFSVIKHLIVRT